MGESGAATSEGIPWGRMAWPGPLGCGWQSAGVSKCVQMLCRERCSTPAMHPLHGSGAEGLQDLIPTLLWGTELLCVALGWIFFL